MPNGPNCVHQSPVHHFSTGPAGSSTMPSPPLSHHEGMGDFLLIVNLGPPDMDGIPAGWAARTRTASALRAE
jgi:hypothetical protein